MPETIGKTITRDILTKISKGIYKAGERLPSVSELCKEFHCSKSPARSALESLREQGRIWSRPGLGYFVLERSSPEERLTFGLIQGPRHYIPGYMELGLRLSEQLLKQGHSLIQCGGLLAPCDEGRDEDRFPEVKRLISCGLSGVFVVPFDTSKLSTLANSRLAS